MRICDGCSSADEVKTMTIEWDGVREWRVYGVPGNGIDLCRGCRIDLHNTAISLLESKKPTATKLHPESEVNIHESCTDIQSSLLLRSQPQALNATEHSCRKTVRETQDCQSDVPLFC
jgi:hypothetical protein